MEIHEVKTGMKSVWDFLSSFAWGGHGGEGILRLYF